MLRRKVLVLVYRTSPRREVLLLKRVKAEKGDWHPVTGNVERHEPILHAAQREVMEETGLALDLEPLGVTYTYEVASGPRKGRYHETCYAGKARPEDAIELSEEHTEHAWLPLGEAREKMNFDGQRRALEALAARLEKASTP